MKPIRPIIDIFEELSDKTERRLGPFPEGWISLGDQDFSVHGSETINPVHVAVKRKSK